MSRRYVLVPLVLSSVMGFAQTRNANLEAPTTLPIDFSQSISAAHSKAGDPIFAKTTQVVVLPSGSTIPAGSRVVGHVITADGFAYDKTPYAHQKQSVLSVHFDAVQVRGESLPLNVTVRAIASPIASWDAQKPQASDMDSLGTLTQIGGDQLVPSQSEVTNGEGDVVAYSRHGGVFAHLIANRDCDGSSVEVSVASYSASACGVYGMGNISAVERGSAATPSTLTLASTHGSPKIWKHTTALLEVLPTQQAALSR